MESDLVNRAMVDRMIAEGDLWSPALIAAFRATPRHLFIDRVLQYQRKQRRWRRICTRQPGVRELALVYSDRALVTRLSPLETQGGEVRFPVSSSSQPSLMAQMLEDLRLAPGLRTMEVGTGTGYNAALLAAVVGAGLVISVEVDTEVLAEARQHLASFAERRIELHHADGRQGWGEGAPYDRIMVTAATPDLEPAWFDQLAPGGLLLAPLVLAPGLAYIVCGTVYDGEFQGRLTRPAYFMALRGEDDCRAPDLAAPSPTGALSAQRAPWAGWFRGRPGRAGWFGLLHALAFFGWLRGLGVHYRAGEDGRAYFGLSDDANHICWFGAADWHFNEGGLDVALRLWHAFLEAGGPRPTEFRLSARPRRPGAALPSGYRRGPSCWQRWQVVEPRDRPVM